MTFPAYPKSRPALPSDNRVGQGTLVEQSRAVAEVQAAVVIAQNSPRSIARAIAALEESCSQPALAATATYRYSRGGSAVSGPSISLAKEIARCWGNISHGVAELRRDDAHGQSEMQAWAWDLESNTRAATTFIVPHKRDKTGGATVLTDMRDIYENNANNGARRLREQIFSVVPDWFIEKAKALCAATLEHGGGKPLPERIADCVRLFSEKGVTLAQLETKLERRRDDWTAPDVAQLGVIYTAIQRGETTRDEEFPPAPVTAEEIRTAPAPVVVPAADGESIGRPVMDAPDAAEYVPVEEPPDDEAATWPEAAAPGSKGGA